jgi:aspartyl-tRNA(Asn)/glutamyl-tRNA(Gln) amidotransferase subunit A
MADDRMAAAELLLDADLTAQAAALAAGATSSAALTEATLARIAARNPALNAYLHVDAAGARAAAAASDARRAAGQARGPLDGLTLGVKDNLDVAGLPTTAGMATRRGRVAADDAFVVARLREAGMVVLGKLNMHEAALGTSNANPFYGDCQHPHRPGFVPGGSSGGSACAVAAGLCALALGTDTMGSVRLPAAFCGVVGLKGSYGAVSTRGSVACSYALDHVGPLVRSARDLALVWPAMSVFDPACGDARMNRPRSVPDRPLVFMVPADVDALALEPAVRRAYEQAIATLTAQGGRVVRIDLACWDFARARRSGLLLVEADLLHEHAADWAAQPQNFSPELRTLLAWCERQPAAACAKAQRVLAAARVEVRRWWAQGDVMLLPTVPQTAFAQGRAAPAHAADLTSIANLAGVPAISLPLPVAPGGLPVGLMAMAPRGHEPMLMGLAAGPLDGVVASP